MDNFIGQSQNKNSWLIIPTIILGKKVQVNLPLEDISIHFSWTPVLRNFLNFKGIMSDGLDRIVASKK